MNEDDAQAKELSQRVGKAFFGQFGDLHSMQRDVIAPIFNGVDVIILAGTGSGKTEAATAPLVERFLGGLDSEAGTTIVYVSPTRALANDLFRRLDPAFTKLNIKLGVRHGERDDLKWVTPPSVLVTTPESLDVMMGKKEKALDSVRAVVIDEVHLLMNEQRGFQLAVLIRRLELKVKSSLQVIALSATVADPKELWRFFRPDSPATVVRDRGRGREVSLKIRVGLSRLDVCNLLGKLSNDEPVKILVFTNSRRECDLLADEIRSSGTFGADVYAHHSSLSKDERLTAEGKFGSTRRAVCVATSTLELGIDIGDIDLVVLYGVPSGWQSFQQRLGRGCRRSPVIEALCVAPEGKMGQPPDMTERLGFQAIQSQIENGEVVSASSYEIFGAAAQQLVAIVHTEGGADVGINRFVEALEPWVYLDFETVELMLEELVNQEVLIKHSVLRRYGAGPGLWQMREDLQIWSNFAFGSRDIEVVHGAITLGNIPATNLLRLQVGSIFIFSSRPWRVISLHGNSVKVVPSQRGQMVELRFNAQGAPLDPALPDLIRKLIRDGTVGKDVVPERIKTEIISEFAPWKRFAADAVLPVVTEGENHFYFTFAGKLANQIISMWANGSISGVTDFVIKSKKALNFAALPADPGALLHYLAQIEMPDEKATVFQKLLPGNLRRSEFSNEWLKHPSHKASLLRLKASEQVVAPQGLFEALGA